MNENRIALGDCYHNGVVYALGYHPYEDEVEIELDDELFTNLDTGIGSNAMAALIDHRRKFDPNLHIKRFIVALKPIKIITGIEDDEDYGLGDNAVYDACGTTDRLDDNKLCDDCIEDDICDDCSKRFVDCLCEDKCESCGTIGCIEGESFCKSCRKYNCCDDCREQFSDCLCTDECDGECCTSCDGHDDDDEGRPGYDDDDEPCECDDEFCEEFISDTFKPMNPFARARWIKSQRRNP